MAANLAKVLLLRQMEINMKEIGLMMKEQDLELKLYQMEIHTKEIFLTVYQMAKVLLLLQMGLNM